MKTVLTIGGSDPVGGAGIQSDMKTFHSLGVYGVSVITAVTSQNTVEFIDSFPLDRKVVRSQFTAILADLAPSAAKTGMLGTLEVVEETVELLRQAAIPFLVVDPVMTAGVGGRLLEERAFQAFTKSLVPMASLITPNVPEAAALSRREVSSQRQMEEAARAIFDMGPKAVVVKGGHLEGDATDVFFDGSSLVLLPAGRIPGKTVHGTGCIFSSAAASFLALGDDMLSSVRKAKDFVLWAISGSLEIGRGARLPGQAGPE